MMPTLRQAIRKACRYFEEMRFIFRFGANQKITWSLLIAMTQFHLRNHFGRTKKNQKEATKRYCLKLMNRTIDVWFRTYAGDLFVLNEVFLDQCYRLPKFLDCSFRNIIDLGANVGLTTLYFSQYFPKANFVCIEPNPENFLLLKRNLSSLRVTLIEELSILILEKLGLTIRSRVGADASPPCALRGRRSELIQWTKSCKNAVWNRPIFSR